MKFFKLFLCASILALTSNAFVQLTSTGIKGGLNFATFGGADAKDPDPQTITAFNIGAFAAFETGGLFVIQPEVLYTVKGVKASGIFVVFNETYSFTATANISYLEIPVLIKLNIPSSSFGILKPNIFAGPAAAFKLRAKTKTDISGLGSQEADLEDTNAMDFGFVFGAGMDIHLPGATIILDIRYDYGLRTRDSSSNPDDVKNRVFSVNTGIAF